MLASLILALAAPTQTAHPSPSPSACTWPQGARILLDARALPGSIQQSLRQHLPDLAPRDAAFQRYDEIVDPPLPTRRFAWAVSGRRIWVVVYEHGGFGHHAHALVFRERGAPHPPGQYWLAPNANLIGPLCAIADAGLAGVHGGIDY